MVAAQKPVFTVQVRELVEFSLRRGDLGGERGFVGPDRALAGTRGHQRLQRSRPAGYQKEVPVAHEIEVDELILRIQGRIDGLLASTDEVLLEEIKTVQGRWDGVPDPLHWAQAKVYGFIRAQGQALEEITLRLAYLHLDAGEVTEFRERFSLVELKAFFEAAANLYLEWIREWHRWQQRRDVSIRGLAFPFTRYRPGQRGLAVAAYRVLARGGRLFLEAPTGIGKTISVLFPAVKALGEGKLERVFYLTARTVGRTVAEQAMRELRQAGLRLRTLTLTAKEKICHREGQPCDARACPLAIGYYDRLHAAMRDALDREELTRPILETLSVAHQVCPFELSLDLSLWVDAVICDYNYVFDPRAYLRRHFAEEGGAYGFLVDEAHNLVDRAREMFSADLESREIQEVRRAIKEALPRCAKALSRLNSALRKLADPSDIAAEPAETSEPGRELDLFASERDIPEALPGRRRREEALTSPSPSRANPRSLSLVTSAATVEIGVLKDVPSGAEPVSGRLHASGVRITRELPAHLLPLLDEALAQAEVWLAQNQPAEFRERLLELYFRMRSFQRTAEGYDERYVTLVETDGGLRVRLFCLDPSFLLRQALGRGKAAVFFSATLTPTDYYRTLLGGSPEDPVIQLTSPFPPEHLAVLVQDRIRTQFKARAGTLADVARAINALVEGRCGNYLVYLPSYQYLTAVQEQFHTLCPEVPMLVQRPAMNDSERDAFLAAFAVDHDRTLVGFAVMGGIFGEGIDLVGDRLIGAIIVGVGLPQLCVERDLIRDYFQEQLGAGFDYAYTFPGMNRVLQAIGRVIRSETDRGVVLLIDTRFAEPRYQRLFPAWWQRTCVRNLAEIGAAVSRFWNGLG